MNVRSACSHGQRRLCESNTVGLQDDRVLLSVWPLATTKWEVLGFRSSCEPHCKPSGDEAFWKIAEDSLVDALGSKGWAYKVDAGGGAFYGPKIDIKIQDAIGRKWQCSTIQAGPSCCCLALTRHIFDHTI